MLPETRVFLSDWARDNVARGKAQGRSESFAEGFARGFIEGMSESIFIVLDVRGLDVPDDVRAAIGECSDVEQLEAWVGAAVTAQSARDLLNIQDAPDPSPTVLSAVGGRHGSGVIRGI
ncbi:hypothetical protein ACQP25_42180 [Microtetraspora malaysiensis]|uniref:hypothetical protein n=1 Tax=Microtetraspora malaysiensis TaxID=161358 RepID=UPI003D8A28B2